MRVAVVGGGITGMSACDVLSRHGIACDLYEKDATLGGLAGSFEVNGSRLERFYHHLFTSDVAMAELIASLGLDGDLEWLPTSNAYFAGRTYRLSTPLDLLRFTRLSLVDRIRLGLLYLRTGLVRDWHPLEEITARDWLVEMAGEEVWHAVWEPLLRGKFGRYADDVAAVWIWNKLKLRGGSRGKGQEERLGYLRGGFGRALEVWEQRLREQGVTIRTKAEVARIEIVEGRAVALRVADERHAYDQIIVTTAPSLLTEMAPGLPPAYRQRLQRIHYLGNVCLVLKLDRSLSDTYWLNVGDPSIPFTGVIEHTNMQRPEDYGGAHLAYLSRYLDVADPAYEMTADALLASYEPYLQRMFPGFSRDWVQACWAWREPYAQPVIGLHYSQLRPELKTPVGNLWLSSMAQVYPEDRGMNYAVVWGQKVAQALLEEMGVAPRSGEVNYDRS
ncbi:MAG: NAD(P)/FAD-dependent oxidoreductase [Anaerolineae bacterium]